MTRIAKSFNLTNLWSKAQTPEPRNKAMELGPRDRLSQAFWHEKQKGRTVKTRHGEVVHVDAGFHIVGVPEGQEA